MTDPHLRLLAMQARRHQRRLDQDEALGAAQDSAATERRLDLRRRAARARARLAAARARRRTERRP